MGEPVAVPVWVGDDGAPIEGPEPLEPHDPAEALRHAGHWVAHAVAAAGEVKAASGPRLGPDPEQSRRSGSGEEVVAPLLVRPLAATTAARLGRVFDRPLRRMQVERDSLEHTGMSCTWRATVRTGPFRRRQATLRIRPSPSGNLTVLELVPLRPRRFRTHSFVLAGVPAIDELRDRLVMHVPRSAVRPTC